MYRYMLYIYLYIYIYTREGSRVGTAQNLALEYSIVFHHRHRALCTLASSRRTSLMNIQIDYATAAAAAG